MRFIFSLFFLMIIANAAKADTIEYWHVYYNQKKLKEFNSYTNYKIILKSSQINPGDSIKVYFFRDTPCYDCITNLIVDDVNDKQVVISKGKGTGNALSFSLTEIVSYKKRTGKTIFNVCYFDRMNVFQAMKPIIFTIKLE